MGRNRGLSLAGGLQLAPYFNVSIARDLSLAVQRGFFKCRGERNLAQVGATAAETAVENYCDPTEQ